MYDICIVGAGPAGMSAAIYAVRKAMKVLILESKMVGGNLAAAPWVENYPGVSGVTGTELAERMKSQLESLGTEIMMGNVMGVKKAKDGFHVKTPEDEYEAKAVIFATGCSYSKLGIPGEKEFLGKGLSYCATCDGPLFSGKKVVVVGGGNSALCTAVMLEDIADEVYLIHRRAELRGDEAMQKKLRKTKVLLNTVSKRVIGEKFVTGLEIEDTQAKGTRVLAVDGVFVSIGSVPTSDIAKTLGVHVDKKGDIVADCYGRTNIPGVYAAGDVTGGIKQIIVAAAQGAAAATEARDYIKYGKHISED